jgi:ubiquinone/menaquinone biosynthesis C-methylase UbiE
MNIQQYNSAAWDNEVEGGENIWTKAVGPEVTAEARKGNWSVVLTPAKPVPREWFGDIAGKDILGLASGGGQQVPIFAAAGARVTCLDNSAGQLRQDALAAQRDGLEVRLEKGDAADLSRFTDKTFDLIFHPCSNVFMPDILPIWRECFRVLRPGGALLAGFANPAIYLFDRYSQEKLGELKVRHKIPYSDAGSLEESELREMIEKNEPLEYSHTLTDQIGGQIAAGFSIAGFYEDYWDSDMRPLDRFMPSFLATCSLKPK